MKVQANSLPVCMMYQEGKQTSTPPKRAAAAEGESESIHFMDAWRIPGVSAYAFCLFFSKLIAYTFLYWLPYYINSTPIEGKKTVAQGLDGPAQMGPDGPAPPLSPDCTLYCCPAPRPHAHTQGGRRPLGAL